MYKYIDMCICTYMYMYICVCVGQQRTAVYTSGLQMCIWVSSGLLYSSGLLIRNLAHDAADCCAQGLFLCGLFQNPELAQIVNHGATRCRKPLWYSSALLSLRTWVRSRRGRQTTHDYIFASNAPGITRSCT